MAERVRWHNLYVMALCAIHDPGCDYYERIEDPLPDQQKALLRRARAHSLRTGHKVSLERGQISAAEALW